MLNINIEYKNVKTGIVYTLTGRRGAKLRFYYETDVKIRYVEKTEKQLADLIEKKKWEIVIINN